MISENIRKAIEVMLSEFSGCSWQLGGLEFYGLSAEFQELLRLCRDFASHEENSTSPPPKAYVFIDSHQGKTSISKATQLEATKNGNSSVYLDGSAGPSQRELLNLLHKTDIFIIVDGVPEAADKRATLLTRFNSLAGKALLFLPPDYIVDENLDASIPKIRVPHIDSRPLDKLALIIGLVREHLRDETGELQKSCARVLQTMPVSGLAAFGVSSLGSKVSDINVLSKSIADAIGIKVNLQAGEAFTQDDLMAIFFEFFSSEPPKLGQGFRLWVEGDTDCRILGLASKLAKEAYKIDLQDGLTINPTGKDREGGASKALEIVLKLQTKRNKDIFLFDNDESGRNAQKELRALDQEALLLESNIACSRIEGELEIEDLIGLSCLDRFYEANPDLNPEKEILRYKEPKARRLVVNGIDKERLIVWLEAYAELSDLENILFLLCDIRRRFSLKNLWSKEEMDQWHKHLVNESNSPKQNGQRIIRFRQSPTISSFG
jgi:hypothetical protein